ncbi:hypothetical protein [Halomarina litorea]|uniref:hypothetical protein n=1 Tax=Halomarina litorea TaxID=2961595 RepID=UPI0020C50FA3|nr:hypothetical protein [Halomarina sp. BCD28]
MVYITAGLAEALLGFASDREPRSVTIGLSVTPAGTLVASASEDGPLDGVPSDTPVFTHFYLPDTGGSVRAVFGMDLASPRTQGRFVSHPDGARTLKQTDDFHEVVFVAVPPWEEVVAYDRYGTRLDLTVLDAEPPVESVT